MRTKALSFELNVWSTRALYWLTSIGESEVKVRLLLRPAEVGDGILASSARLLRDRPLDEVEVMPASLAEDSVDGASHRRL